MVIPPQITLAFGALLATSIFAPAAAISAERARPERVVVYINDDDPRVLNALSVLRSTLARTDIAGRYNVRIQHLVVDMWKPDEIAARLQKALLARPAAVIAPNSEIAALAKSLTSDIPIIFASHQDPIRIGLIDSLARPGKNLTGFTFFVPVDLKRLELLRQLAPRARKLGIVIDRWWLEESNGKEVAFAARKEFGFDSTFFPAETLEELKAQLSSPQAREMDAWYVPYTALPYYEPGLLVRLLNALDRPVMFPATLFVEKGGLASYESQMTLAETASLWSTMIGLVLDGLPPGEIPIERPKSFELALNVEAARRLGLVIPANLIKRADKVFDAAPTLAARKR